MSDNQALIERLFEDVINNGRLETADEVMAAEFVDHGPMGEMQGVDAFKEMVAMWRSAVADVHCSVEQFFESGELVGWLVHVTGTHEGEMMGIPASGRRIDYVTPNIARIRDGRVLEHWADQGMFQFLQQIGAIEQPAGAGG